MPTVSAPSTLPQASGAIDNTGAQRIRNDFPILAQQINGHGLVYLDSGAT
ncbi:cysteine desulfurase, partial [Arthrobacter deserti]|nr:cysteine desulfurase [Arthrobacter deserti]